MGRDQSNVQAPPSSLQSTATESEGRTIRILAVHTSAFNLRSSSASCLRAYSSAIEREHNSEFASSGYTFMSFLLFAVVGRSNQPTDCRSRYSRKSLALSYASLLQARGVTPREDQTSERSCGSTTGNSSDHRVLIKIKLFNGSCERREQPRFPNAT